MAALLIGAAMVAGGVMFVLFGHVAGVLLAGAGALLLWRMVRDAAREPGDGQERDRRRASRACRGASALGSAPTRTTVDRLSSSQQAFSSSVRSCSPRAAEAPAETKPPGATTTGSVVYRWGVVGNRGAITNLQLDRPTEVAGVEGRVVQIATSNSDGYALTSTGAVYAWGVNSYGELGDGALTPYETKAVEVDFPAGIKITSLPNPMPFDAGLAIDSTGHAWGWGLNASDDLCLSGLIESRPQQLPCQT